MTPLCAHDFKVEHIKLVNINELSRAMSIGNEP